MFYNISKNFFKTKQFVIIGLLLTVFFPGYSQAKGVCKTAFNSITQIFETRQRPLKAVKFLNIQKTQVEQKLRAKGYRQAYIQGMDSANYLIQLGRKLRALNIDPLKTHIEDFALLIPAHIEHIRRSLIRKAYIIQSEPVQEKLKILQDIEADALKRIRNNSVTYAYWHQLNYLLAEIVSLSPRDLHKAGTDKKITQKEALKKFPELIILPTIEPLGFMAFNQFAFTGTAPAVLPNTNQRADGTMRKPVEYYLHDFAHTNAGRGFGATTSVSWLSRFHNRFTDYVKTTEPDKAEILSAVYFIITHEHTVEITHRASLTQAQQVFHLIRAGGEYNNRFLNLNDFGILLPPAYQRKLGQGRNGKIKISDLRNVSSQIQSGLEDMAKTFSRTAQEILSAEAH